MTGRNVKTNLIKQIKDAPKRKGGEKNHSFEDWTDATNVEKDFNAQLDQRIQHFENFKL